ncbi:MAG: hypothetical protein AAF612_12490 [Planctomycetota bacterium]
MSYDLQIASDTAFRGFMAREPLARRMPRIPDLKPDGDGFVIDEPPDRRAEIYLEVLNEDGDNTEEPGGESAEINCITITIPYAYLNRNTFDRDYLPTLHAIAELTGWPLMDLQTDQVIPRVSRRPWWRVW